jgi:hypothetical protein
MEYPNNRTEAKKAGAKYYFTGKPCTRGHVALRKTKGACVQCIKEDWAKDNERRKTLPKSEAAREAGKRYYERNREVVIARANARPIEDKRHYKKNWEEKNPELRKTYVSLRKRRHRNATPPWLTKEQKLVIRNLYLSAMTLTKATGERYVVDHIVPLSNSDVCGLHVPWNLRVITQEENLKKSNKHTP